MIELSVLLDSLGMENFLPLFLMMIIIQLKFGTGRKKHSLLQLREIIILYIIFEEIIRIQENLFQLENVTLYFGYLME